MDKMITAIYKDDLTGTDVDYLTKGKANLLLYKDLLNYQSIFDAFGKFKGIILLFPTTSDNFGHWVAILQTPSTKTITHFDSYALSWTQELGYSSNQYVKRNILGEMYNQAQQQGWKVTYNKYRFQEMANSINTCGRHACLRVRFDYLNSDEYAKLFLKQKETADWLVTALTFVALDQDETDEEQVIRSLGLKQK